MTDIVSPEVRSRMMAAIRSRDTKPEMMVRRYLHAQGFRYSLHRKDLPGRPDLTLRRRNAVVLVNGCFWHGHSDCSFANVPATRRDFWGAKIAGNVARDARSISRLASLGWRIAVVWECALRKEPSRGLRQLERFLRSNHASIDIRF